MGKAILAATVGRNHEFTSLKELLEAVARNEIDTTCGTLPRLPRYRSAEFAEHAHTLGSAALRAAGLSDRPSVLDQMSRVERNLALTEFTTHIHFVEHYRLWQFAPEPLSAYSEIICTIEEPEARAHAYLTASSIIRETGDLGDALAMLRRVEPLLATLPDTLVAMFHAAAGNTYREFAAFDQSNDHYRTAAGIAAKALCKTSAPDPFLLALLRDVTVQRVRLHSYSGNPTHRPDPDDMPAAVLDQLAATEGERAEPLETENVETSEATASALTDQGIPVPASPVVLAELLTMAQTAARQNLPQLAFGLLVSLAEATPPHDYWTLAMLHSEAASLARLGGGRPDLILWHTYLAICADLLTGSRRELGGRLTLHAQRLSECGQYLAARNLAQWGLASNRLPLFAADVDANAAYVLFRDGSLGIAGRKFDDSLAISSSDFVRAQRDIVTVLLGGPNVEISPPRNQSRDSDRKLSARTVHNIATWRAAAQLFLCAPTELADWTALLLYSTGPLPRPAPALQSLLDSMLAWLPELPPELPGPAQADRAKGILYGCLARDGVLGHLERYWGIPDWATTAWVLSSPTPPALRSSIALDIAAGVNRGYHRETIVEPGPGLQPVPRQLRRDLVANVDRLIALSHAASSDDADLGSPNDLRALRRWAIETLATHGRQLTFAVRDMPLRPHDEDTERRTQAFNDAASRLPFPLQMAMLIFQGEREQASVHGIGDVRDFLEQQLARLPAQAADVLRQVYALRPHAPDIIVSNEARLRAEAATWFTHDRQGVIDVVQGTAAVHTVVIRPAAHVEARVEDITISRVQAESVTARYWQAAGDAADAHLAQFVAALRIAAADTTEVAIRLRAPWEAMPVENIPDRAGHSLSTDHVVVRRHSRRPNFRSATAPLGHRVEVFGDPMGGTGRLELPGAAAEATAVAATLGGRVYLRDSCTWERLRACARTADLLWISTHCEPVRQLGDLPALRLRDRWILPSELAALEVNPELVVFLSICGDRQCEVLSNTTEPPLAASFIDAGASLTISPLRPIDDLVWGPLIVDAVRDVVAGERTYVALVRALNARTPHTERPVPWTMHA
ncbi:MAG: hypothetical protein QG671_2532 [Actinomycetota bacterium]|nr:hypothetical protein [Actinomycetota bacterium]